MQLLGFQLFWKYDGYEGSKVLQHTKKVTKCEIWYIEAERKAAFCKSALFLFKIEIAILRLWDCKRLKMQLK